MIVRILLTLILTMAAFSTVADEQLWGMLQSDPNMIVLIRNAESSGNKDGANMLVWDASGNCKGESTLTEKGRVHAKKIGEAFTQHGVSPIVISSPMCRCRETSKIAFGEYITDPDLRQTATGDTQAEAVFHARVSTLLSRHRGNTPIVFVNHRPNIDSLTMELLDIGELLVGTVTEAGEVEVLGRIRISP